MWGIKVWVPTPGRLALGCWVWEGVASSAARVWGYQSRKIFDYSDAKSCILVISRCEISCFLKTTAKKLGDQYPRSLWLMRLWHYRSLFQTYSMLVRTAVGPKFTALQLVTRHHFVEFCIMTFGSIPSHLGVVIHTGSYRNFSLPVDRESNLLILCWNMSDE